MVDAQVSGTCGGSPVKVRVFSRAPITNPSLKEGFVIDTLELQFLNFHGKSSTTSKRQKYSAGEAACRTSEVLRSKAQPVFLAKL